MDNNIDKWGSLSMPERASLISLFTGSGVTSLDEMRALYNEYGNGGGIHIDPSKRGTFTSAAKRHGMGVQEFASRVLSNRDDYSTAMVRKANFARNAAKWYEEGGDLDDNDPKDPYNSKDGWFRYWYENRPYQIMDAINWQLDGTKSIEKAKKAIYDAINSYNETYIPTTINGNAYSGKMPSGVTNYWDRDNGLSRYVIGTSHYGYSDNPERDFVNNSYGLNDPEFRQIIYTQDPYNGILKRTLIHERSHAIPWFIKDRVRDKRLLNDSVNYDKYLDNINEIYSRLNEFRFKNNLDPRKTYTEDDIIKWRESGALKNFDLDRYDNDSVYNLINNVASNNIANNLPKNANYAAYGDDFSDSFKFGLDYEPNINNNTKSNSDFSIVNDFGNGKYHDNKIPTDNAETYFARQVNNIVNQQHNDIYKMSDAYIGQLIRKKYGDNIKRLQGELYDQGNFVDKGIRLGKINKVGDIQKFLKSKNYITDRDVDGILGKKTITAIQRYLNDSGYDSGKPDGIIGEKTNAALSQYNKDFFFVDGIIGRRTINAYKKSLLNKHGFDVKFADNDDIDDCAKFVRKRFDQAVGETRRNGVNGNAWTMIGNILDHGGQSLYNIYNNDLMKEAKSPNDVARLTKQLTNEKAPDFNQVDVGDVIGIYIPGSTHMQEAIDTGTTKNTHVGVVVSIENGTPVVEHKVGGKVRRDKINNLGGAKLGRPIVTAIVRPSISEQVEDSISINNKKSDLKIPDKWKNDQLNEYMESLSGMKQVSQSLFKYNNPDFIEKAAIGILGRETFFMNRKQSDVAKDIKHPGSMVMANARKIVHKMSQREFISGDLTKFKFNSIPENYRKAIGLVDPEQLNNDPSVAARAVYIYLSRAYDFYKRYAKINPDLGMTEEDIENATIDSYNKGIKYTGVSKKYIEKLRYESNPEHKVKSIASTNYSKVGKFGRMLIPNNITEDPVMNMNIIGRSFTRLLDVSPDIAQSIANVTFDKFSKPTIAYVGAARKYMKQIK